MRKLELLYDRVTLSCDDFVFQVPRNKGWGVTFTITNTFRLLAFIIFTLQELASVQDRHNALSEAVISYLQSETEQPRWPPGEGAHGAPFDSVVHALDQLEDALAVAERNSAVRRRPSEEQRLTALQAGIVSKTKRGGQWVRRLEPDGTVAWVSRDEASIVTADEDDFPRLRMTNTCLMDDTPRDTTTDGDLSPPSQINAQEYAAHTPATLGRNSRSFKTTVGWYLRTFSADGALTWRPGEELEGIVNVTEGLVGDISSSMLAAVATLSFQEKCLWVRAKLGQMRIPWEAGHSELRVRRSALLDDSVRELNNVPVHALRQIFRFQFEGEQGLDAGGVAREWFMCLTRDIFNTSLGLFKFASTDNITYQLNPLAEVLLGPDRMRELCVFVGRYLAKALFDQHLIPAHLVRPLYKHMLGVPVGFSDLQFVDSQLYDNMSWLVSERNVEQLSLTFTISTADSAGHMQEEDLVEGGSTLLVTDENKHFYLRCAFQKRMLDQQRAALEHLLKGFYDLIPPGSHASCQHA
jgi:hypothetical protein